LGGIFTKVRFDLSVASPAGGWALSNKRLFLHFSLKIASDGCLIDDLHLLDAVDMVSRYIEPSVDLEGVEKMTQVVYTRDFGSEPDIAEYRQVM
jgi:hypothetical protein